MTEQNRSTFQTTVEVPVPARESTIYRHGATDDVLRVLIDNPYQQFPIRELGRLTDTAPQSVSRAIDVLEANEVVDVAHDGNRRLVEINRTRLSKPDDPVIRIPQKQFHRPVRAALDAIDSGLQEVRGILLFGSVARGKADRRSDIDLWVLAGQPAAQHRANEIGMELGQERFNGDRYEFQILVETPESARVHLDRLEPVFADAITLRESDDLQTLKAAVFANA